MEVELGSEVKDSITGCKGVATARCIYINGCVQYKITPTQLKDGVPQKEYWIDEERVVLITVKAVRKRRLSRPPGGPGNHPAKNNPPSLAGYEQEK